jgi:hypothetical protein
MPLAQLSRGAVAELARRAGRSACGVHEVTQGNPFYVTELLAGDAQTLPASVRDAVLARAAPLSPEARDVLELASVAPAQIEIELLDVVVDDAPMPPPPSASRPVCCSSMAPCFRHELAGVRSRPRCCRDGRRASAAVFDTLSVRGAPAVRPVSPCRQGGKLSGAVLALAPSAGCTRGGAGVCATGAAVL